MPTYDYRCMDCDEVFEAIHGMTERPEVECPYCEASPAKKLISSPHISSHNTTIKGHLKDQHARETDMRQDLAENYGVEKVKPFQRKTLTSVYDDIKQQGTFVRDRMQAEKAQKEDATAKKQRAWKKEAQKRAPQRSRERVERRKAEEAAKRKITVSSTSA